jgi:hypothetical protein
MDLEEKGHFTPGHEPKVIPDAIIIATAFNCYTSPCMGDS